MGPEELLEKIAKLPKWAQEHIEHLNCQLRSTTAERDIAYSAVNGGEQSNIKIAGNRHEKPVMYLPEREVTFILDDKNEIEVCFVREHKTNRKIGVRIRTNWQQMSIAPEVSNTVAIFVKER